MNPHKMLGLNCINGRVSLQSYVKQQITNCNITMSSALLHLYVPLKNTRDSWRISLYIKWLEYSLPPSFPYPDSTGIKYTRGLWCKCLDCRLVNCDMNVMRDSAGLGSLCKPVTAVPAPSYPREYLISRNT